MVTPVPAYGSHSLADLGPAVLAGLGVAGELPAGLGLGELRRVVVLLVDGLGAHQLAAHAELAPFLSSLAATPLTACFPTTTVTSLTSLGTGLPPGQHGLPGYASWVAEAGSVVHWLTWRARAAESETGADLRESLVPEDVQPHRTVFERAVHDGIAVSHCAPAAFRGTGFSRAALRGGDFTGSISDGDLLAQAAAGARAGTRSLVYAYLSELDTIGHVRGPGSDAWCEQLRRVDSLAERLAAVLPAGADLLVTADHGMVGVPPADRVDLGAHPELLDGVRVVAGEPRVRQLHVAPGAEAGVVAAWTATLGERMWVATRDEAIAAGLFGPRVTPAAAARVGDVLAVAHGSVAVVDSADHPKEAALLGHHGALTPAELDVPLLRTRA